MGGQGGYKGGAAAGAKQGATTAAEAASSAAPRSDFFYSAEAEPHKERRRLILEAHPEIEELQGSEPRVVPIVLAIIASQLTIAYYQQTWSTGLFFIVCWIYGGAANHALSLMTHELSHNLVFPPPKSPWLNMNEYFGMLCNISMGVPSSTKFKKYHMEHHIYQGKMGADTDLPTYWEGRFFTNSFLKAIWLLCQPLFYALRPGFVRPKNLDAWDVLNILVVVSSNVLIGTHWGPRAVLYLVLSTLLGMGFHPVAGHFIAEHYVVHDGISTKQETYSYYGALNYLCWNVGYHNEHHDFPKVPGWRLPMIKKIAPEFYDNLPQHKSWTMVLYNYIFDPAYGPFNRVLRGAAPGAAGAAGGAADGADKNSAGGAVKGAGGGARGKSPAPSRRQSSRKHD